MNKTSIAAALCLGLMAATSANAATPLAKVRAAMPTFHPVMMLKSGLTSVVSSQALPGLPQVGAIVANHNIGGFGNGKLVGASIASATGTGNGGAIGVALRSGALSGNGGLIGIAAASGPASGYGRVLSVGLANTGQPVHIGLLGRNLVGH